MMRILLGLACAAGLVLAAGPGRAADPAPFELVRSLEAVQDQIARGNAGAAATQPKLVAHIAERFAATDVKLWHDHKNGRAAALYLFSGGQPRALHDAVDQGAFAKEDEPLVKGALAYAEGRDGEARGLLMDLVPLSLPPSLGAHLALVQATIIGREDAAKAQKLLDTARLLAPGTLVEEAALRREIFTIRTTEDFDRLLFLSRQYLRRFGKSFYADNFRQRFAAVVLSLGLSKDAAAMPRIDKLLAELGPDEALKFYLAIAQTATMQARLDMARFASDRAARLAAKRPTEAARAQLYSGAAAIVTDDYDKGLSALQAIDPAHLPPADVELRSAALALADTIRLPEQVAEEVAMTEQPVKKKTPVMDQARKAIAAADALLGGQP